MSVGKLDVAKVILEGYPLFKQFHREGGFQFSFLFHQLAFQCEEDRSGSDVRKLNDKVGGGEIVHCGEEDWEEHCEGKRLVRVKPPLHPAKEQEVGEDADQEEPRGFVLPIRCEGQVVSSGGHVPCVHDPARYKSGQPCAGQSTEPQPIKSHCNGVEYKKNNSPPPHINITRTLPWTISPHPAVPSHTSFATDGKNRNTKSGKNLPVHSIPPQSGRGEGRGGGAGPAKKNPAVASATPRIYTEEEAAPNPAFPSIVVGGVSYEIAQPLDIPSAFFDTLSFTERDAEEIDETVREVLERLDSACRETVCDISTGKLLRKIPYHSYSYECQMLREPGEIVAVNGAKVQLHPCVNGNKCVSQYIRGFTGKCLMGWMQEHEWLNVTCFGVQSAPPDRPCLLCYRSEFTTLKAGHHVHEKSKVDRQLSSVSSIIPPMTMQAFFNACNPLDSETYKKSHLMKVGDFPASHRSGYADLEKPLVSFDKDRLFWYEDAGVMRVDQSALRVQSGPSPGGHSSLPFTAEGTRAAKGGGRRRETESPGPFTSAAPFFERGRNGVDAAHEPSVQLFRLCSSYFGTDMKEICFSENFRECAETCTALDPIDPGESFGYNSWFERGGYLEESARHNRYVKLLVVRLLCLNVLRKVQDKDLSYWLHLFIDQHIPFLTLVYQKETITADDVIEPCLIEPVCDSTIPIDAFLSNDALLSYRAWDCTTATLTKIALKFMPNTTTSWDKRLTWGSLSPADQEIMRPVLQCVFLGNFRHGSFRPDIAQRLRIHNSSIELLLEMFDNDPLVISKGIMECITYVLEKLGFAQTEDQACRRYMRQTIEDCDYLIRLAIAQNRAVTKADIRSAAKSHQPLFTRAHRKAFSMDELSNKILETTARSISYKLLNKNIKLSLKYCILARLEGKTFEEKLRLAGFSRKAYAYCASTIEKCKNQKNTYKAIAEQLKRRFPGDALIMCRLYACMRGVQRAILHPVDIDTYERQREVAAKSPSHKCHFFICVVCLTVDIPGVPGWRKVKRFYSEVEEGGRMYCSHCEGKPSVMKMSLMGARLQLLDKSYMLCTLCDEPNIVTTSNINLQGAFVCTYCINKPTPQKKTTAIWPRPDKRHLRGRNS